MQRNKRIVLLSGWIISFSRDSLNLLRWGKHNRVQLFAETNMNREQKQTVFVAGVIGLVRCWCRHFCSFVFSASLSLFPSPSFCRSPSHPDWSFVSRVVLSGLRGALIMDCLCYQLLTVTNKKKPFAILMCSTPTQYSFSIVMDWNESSWLKLKILDMLGWKPKLEMLIWN